MLKPIADIPTGARVRKPSAKFLDFAYGREGTIIRETFDGRELQGVLFDGGRAVIEYPPDTELEQIAE